MHLPKTRPGRRRSGLFRSVRAGVLGALLHGVSVGAEVGAGARAPTPTAAVAVVLAHDGTGEFGPQTPGTRTDGWQEALDFCVRESRDLTVKGGFGGRKAIYHIRETIRFPAAQDFRVDGGVYVLNWEGAADQDLLVLDSAMNCEYQLGILVYGGARAAMRIRPEKPVPIDGFPAWIETQVRSQGMADPQPFKPGERASGTGVVFEGVASAIECCDFFFASVLNFRTCLEFTGSVRFNSVRVPHLHSNADRGTLCVAGAGTVGNRMAFTLGVDQGAEGVTGIVLSGIRNTLEIGRRPSNKPFLPGRTLVLGEESEGNAIHLTDTGSEDPLGFFTDGARVPSNQVTWNGPALPFRQLTNIGVEFRHVQRLVPASLRWSGGTVEAVTLERAGQLLDLGRATDREVLLSVGDTLRIRSRVPPTVHWIPFKPR